MNYPAIRMCEVKYIVILSLNCIYSKLRTSYCNEEINHGSQNVLGVLTWIGDISILSRDRSKG